jgi:mRNA interferase MazF
VVISQGEIWWAEFPEPAGSTPGYRRPVIVIQGDAINRSKIATVMCIPLTSNLKWAEAPGNVKLTSRITGLPKDSVANVAQLIVLDKEMLVERAGKLPRAKMELMMSGIDIILGR